MSGHSSEQPKPSTPSTAGLEAKIIGDWLSIIVNIGLIIILPGPSGKIAAFLLLGVNVVRLYIRKEKIKSSKQQDVSYQGKREGIRAPRQIQKSIEYHRQALAIARETGDRRSEGKHVGNLGLVYRELGQVEKAIEYHKQALTISRKIGDRQGEGADLGNLGLAYRDLGQVKKAREMWGQALRIFEEIKSPNAERVRSWLKSLEE